VLFRSRVTVIAMRSLPAGVPDWVLSLVVRCGGMLSVLDAPLDARLVYGSVVSANDVAKLVAFAHEHGSARVAHVCLAWSALATSSRLT
jgi:hypothetical protein